MSPKRSDDVAPPPIDDEWRIRFFNNQAAEGWQELCRHVPANTRVCYERLRNDPLPVVATSRHQLLQHDLRKIQIKGGIYDQWQYEVTE
ncbi:hypothetical protein [Planobispora takensis]|uniref:Uncharacterized protein n=1 Tax=Planobispora takensis TaxID=1367882 RepID=A0A8J3T7L3_9ACTN|nr:hypothetical protein [Planobispora takensis]GII02404.1 hypothetical protein Pta02_44120 [Planobispora takensis]